MHTHLVDLMHSAVLEKKNIGFCFRLNSIFIVNNKRRKKKKAENKTLCLLISFTVCRQQQHDAVAAVCNDTKFNANGCTAEGDKRQGNFNYREGKRKNQPRVFK